MSALVDIVVLASLTILPGSWLVFGFQCGGFDWKTKLALAVALSPAILGVELLVMKFAGIDFSHAALIAVGLSLPGAILVLRQVPRSWRPSLSKAQMFPVLVFLLFAGYPVLYWFTIPGLRIFSWHALMHTDIVYALTRSSLLPEEPEMAGLALAYGWIDHAFWSFLGWLNAWPQSYVYPLSNLIWLLVTFVLAYELARTGLRMHQSGALVSVTLCFLGINIVGSLLRLVRHDSLRWQFLWGDLRYTPLLGKYVGFESIPFAFPLLIGLALACSLGMRRKVESFPLIVAALLLALGLIYPLLFPAGLLIVGCFVFLLAIRLPRETPDYSWRELLGLSAGAAISSVGFIGYLSLLTENRAKQSFEFGITSEFVSKSVNTLGGLAPLVILALPFLVHMVHRRDGPALLLTFSGLFSIPVYLFSNLGELEYKYLLVASICLAPLAAAGVDRFLLRLGWMRWALVLATPLGLALIYIMLTFSYGTGVPRSLANAPSVVERSFWLELSPTDENAGWTTAVRESTPSDTVLVTWIPRIRLGTFANRSLYVPDYADGMAIAGFSLDTSFYLLEQRGYPKDEYERRLRTVQELYTESDAAQLTAALQTLRELNRPLAIHFVDDRIPALQWMRQQGIGSELISDGKNVVWFIPRAG